MKETRKCLPGRNRGYGAGTSPRSRRTGDPALPHLVTSSHPLGFSLVKMLSTTAELRMLL